MKNKMLLPLIIVLMFAMLAACSSTTTVDEPAASNPPDSPIEPVASEGTIPEIMIDAADFSYAAPEIIDAGWVRVTLTNSGQEPHHVQFLRLNDGVTVEQFEQALEQGEGPALALTQQVGGVGAIAPALSAQAILNLPAGEYVILCFIPSPSDQISHHDKGMIKSLTVQPTSAALGGEPSADLVVRLKDFLFELPEALPAGQMTIQVINEGPEPHEFNILRLADGKTTTDVVKYLSTPDGPPPFTPVGGMNGLDVGLSGYVEFDFQPGTYVAICNIPSPKAEGHPHSALGMVKEFSVESSATSNFTTGKFVNINDKAQAYEYYDDGSFAFYAGSKDPVFIGTYIVQDNLITIENPSETNPNCVGPATYQWAFEADKLTFLPTGEDPCKPRRESNAATYMLVSSPLVEFPSGKFVAVGDRAKGYQFNPDGTFGYYYGGNTPVVEGRYTVEGNLLSVINPTESNPQCQGSVLYQWFFDKGKLTFAPVGEDTCRARSDSFGDTYIVSE